MGLSGAEARKASGASEAGTFYQADLYNPSQGPSPDADDQEHPIFHGRFSRSAGAGLCTGLVAYYGGGFQALSASTGPIELRYVPPDAAVIAYADVGAIMNSELRLRIKEGHADPAAGAGGVPAETGIDIERDIQYVVAAVTPGTHSALLVARGNFNPTELESLAVEHGGVVETYTTSA